MSIGSGADNDWTLPARGVSRHHALVEPADGAFRLRDLGSKNGLLVGGRRQGEVVLCPGLQVQIGEAVVTVEEVATSDGEVALSWERRPSGSRGTAASETAGLSPEPGRRVGAALQLVRQVADLDARRLAENAPRLLADTRRLLGASAVLLVERGSDGEVAVVACDGAPGPAVLEAALTALEAAAGSTEPAWRLTSGGQVGVFTAGARTVVMALYAQPGSPPPPWQWDLLGFLGERLAAPSRGGARRRPDPSSAASPRLRPPPGMVLGDSIAMRRLLAEIERAATSELPVLLLGETGTGKELFARLLHASCPAADGPFEAVNCAAIPADLLEAELFGVAPGAATNVEARPGLFVRADGGTVFLDEIGDMPAPLQAKLLRVLQEREVVPVGGTKPRRIQVRLVSASNQDLHRSQEEGRFRPDLYYRLAGIPCHLPPLRERPEDLPQLVAAFAERAATSAGKRLRGISRRALRLLLDHPWPGNVRELETVMERAVLRCPDGGIVEAAHLDLGPARSSPVPSPASRDAPAPTAPGGETPTRTFEPLADRLEHVQRRAIHDALAATGGNKTAAAELLGVTRQGLRLMMRRLGAGDT